MKRVFFVTGTLVAAILAVLNLLPGAAVAFAIISLLSAIVCFCCTRKYKRAFSAALVMVTVFAAIVSHIIAVGIKTEVRTTYDNRTVTMVGTVIGETDHGDAFAYLVETEDMQVFNKTQKLKVNIGISSKEKIDLFDRVRVTSTLAETNSSFDSEKIYLAGYATDIENLGDSGERSLRRLLSELNQEVIHLINTETDRDVSGILLGFIVGGSNHLDDETYSDFYAAGILHTVAVSGMHMSILASFITAILTILGIGKGKHIFFIIPITLFYCAFSGFTPSAIRAVVMLVAAMSADAISRRPDPLNLLGFAATVMLTANPALVKNVSFVLSFSAMAGILLLSPVINRGLRTERIKSEWIREALQVVITSVGSTLGTLPAVAFVYGATSSVAVLSNVLISFAVAPALISGMLAVLCALVFGGGAVSDWIFFFCEKLLYYIKTVAKLTANIPFSVVSVSVRLHRFA